MAFLSDVDCLAHWVKFHRRARNWTQGQLADKIGVAQSRISEIERGTGNPEIGTLSKLAKALGVSISALLMPVDDAVLEKVDT